VLTAACNFDYSGGDDFSTLGLGLGYFEDFACVIESHRHAAHVIRIECRFVLQKRKYAHAQPARGRLARNYGNFKPIIGPFPDFPGFSCSSESLRGETAKGLETARMVAPLPRTEHFGTVVSCCPSPGDGQPQIVSVALLARASWRPLAIWRS
jgi:hypothetical protein